MTRKTTLLFIISLFTITTFGQARKIILSGNITDARDQ